MTHQSKRASLSLPGLGYSRSEFIAELSAMPLSHVPSGRLCQQRHGTAVMIPWAGVFEWRDAESTPTLTPRQKVNRWLQATIWSRFPDGIKDPREPHRVPRVPLFIDVTVSSLAPSTMREAILPVRPATPQWSRICLLAREGVSGGRLIMTRSVERSRTLDDLAAGEIVAQHHFDQLDGEFEIDHREADYFLTGVSLTGSEDPGVLGVLEIGYSELTVRSATWRTRS